MELVVKVVPARKEGDRQLVRIGLGFDGIHVLPRTIHVHRQGLSPLLLMLPSNSTASANSIGAHTSSCMQRWQSCKVWRVTDLCKKIKQLGVPLAPHAFAQEICSFGELLVSLSSRSMLSIGWKLPSHSACLCPCTRRFSALPCLPEQGARLQCALGSCEAMGSRRPTILQCHIDMLSCGAGLEADIHSTGAAIGSVAFPSAGSDHPVPHLEERFRYSMAEAGGLPTYGLHRI